MKAYSQDLREKVMAAVAQAKQPNRQIAETLGIGEATIERWTRRQRQTGSVAAAAHAGGVARVLAPHAQFLRAAVKAQPDISLEELRVRIKTDLKLNVSGSMVSRELTKLRLPQKKVAPRQRTGDRTSKGPAHQLYPADAGSVWAAGE